MYNTIHETIINTFVPPFLAGWKFRQEGSSGLYVFVVYPVTTYACNGMMYGYAMRIAPARC